MAVGNSKDTDQYLLFYINDQLLGINVLEAKEIITDISVTKIPEAPDFVDGIMELRDEIIPIVELRERFNIKKQNTNISNDKIIIVDIEGNILGLRVDKVKGIVRVNNDSISTPPEITTRFKKGYIKGIAKTESNLFLIMNLNRLFSAEEVNQLDLPILSEEEIDQILKEGVSN